jgi:selenocysteine lyase/cysteine desulfurase
MLTCQRHLFEIPEGVHYLNCAYMSPLLRHMEEAGIAGIRRKRVPSGVTPRDFLEDSDRLRSLFARLIGAPDAQRIAIVPSVSYGTATVVRNLALERGQNIVVLHEQFPSNVYPWRSLAQRDGIELRTVSPPEDQPQRGREWNARILEAIDSHTAVVALGHVHWADGTRFDLEQIGARAREAGAALVIDGTQSVGALPFDVQRLQPDALICAGYKWLLGPYSIGAAYLGPRFGGGTPLEETWLGRLGSEDFRGLVNYQDEYQPGALRYDMGERSNFILLPMLIAALEQLLEWGVANIQEYCRALTRDLIHEACGLGFTVEAEEARAAHLFGLRLPRGLDPDTLAEASRERNVFVSVRGSALRISPHVYNDARDVDALLDVLRRSQSDNSMNARKAGAA